MNAANISYKTRECLTILKNPQSRTFIWAWKINLYSLENCTAKYYNSMLSENSFVCYTVLTFSFTILLEERK